MDTDDSHSEEVAKIAWELQRIAQRRIAATFLHSQRQGRGSKSRSRKLASSEEFEYVARVVEAVEYDLWCQPTKRSEALRRVMQKAILRVPDSPLPERESKTFSHFANILFGFRKDLSDGYMGTPSYSALKEAAVAQSNWPNEKSFRRHVFTELKKLLAQKLLELEAEAKAVRAGKQTGESVVLAQPVQAPIASSKAAATEAARSEETREESPSKGNETGDTHDASPRPTPLSDDHIDAPTPELMSSYTAFTPTASLLEKIRATPGDDALAVLALGGGSRRGRDLASRDLFTDDFGIFDEARASLALDLVKAKGRTAGIVAALRRLAQTQSCSVHPGRWDIVQRGINRAAKTLEARVTQVHEFQRLSIRYGRLDLGGRWHEMEVEAATLAARIPDLDPLLAQSLLTAVDGATRADFTTLRTGHPYQLIQLGRAVEFVLRFGSFGERVAVAVLALELHACLGRADTPATNQQLLYEFLSHLSIGDVTLDLGQPATVPARLAAMASRERDRCSAAELVARARR